jgi:hypothetical protein
MDCLERIYTVLEAAHCWGKNPASVKRGIGIGKKPLIARKIGNTYVISLESLERRWGPPLRAKPPARE